MERRSKRQEGKELRAKDREAIGEIGETIRKEKARRAIPKGRTRREKNEEKAIGRATQSPKSLQKGSERLPTSANFEGDAWLRNRWVRHPVRAQVQLECAWLRLRNGSNGEISFEIFADHRLDPNPKMHEPFDAETAYHEGVAEPRVRATIGTREEWLRALSESTSLIDFGITLAYGSRASVFDAVVYCCRAITDLDKVRFVSSASVPSSQV